jgi:hypothetical protein
MRKIGAAILALGLTGCATVKPIVHYTCMGCTALLASGVCALGEKPAGKVEVIQCKPGEVLVIENWKAVSREGALPVLGCESP